MFLTLIEQFQWLFQKKNELKWNNNGFDKNNKK